MPAKKRKAAPPKAPIAPLLERVKSKLGGIPRVNITEKGWDQIAQWARSGATLEQIADLLGIAERTLRAPHLKERVEDVKRTAWAARRIRLMELMLQAAEERPGSRAAQKLMGPVLGWHERVEMSGPQGAPLELVHSTRDAAIHTIREALQKMSAAKKDKAAKA